MKERMNVDSSDRLIRALAHPQRIELVRALMKRPQYVSALATTLNMDRSTVSYNLAVLESAQLLDSKYEILEQPHSKGKAARIFSVNKSKLKEAIDLIKAIGELR